MGGGMYVGYKSWSNVANYRLTKCLMWRPVNGTVLPSLGKSFMFIAAHKKVVC